MSEGFLLSLEASGMTSTALLTIGVVYAMGSLCEIGPEIFRRSEVFLSDFLAFFDFFVELLKATEGLIFCRRISRLVRCDMRSVTAGRRLPDLTTF